MGPSFRLRSSPIMRNSDVKRSQRARYLQTPVLLVGIGYKNKEITRTTRRTRLVDRHLPANRKWRGDAAYCNKKKAYSLPVGHYRSEHAELSYHYSIASLITDHRSQIIASRLIVLQANAYDRVPQEGHFLSSCISTDVAKVFISIEHRPTCDLNKSIDIEACIFKHSAMVFCGSETKDI